MPKRGKEESDFDPCTNPLASEDFHIKCIYICQSQQKPPSKYFKGLNMMFQVDGLHDLECVSSHKDQISVSVFVMAASYKHKARLDTVNTKNSTDTVSDMPILK